MISKETKRHVLKELVFYKKNSQNSKCISFGTITNIIIKYGIWPPFCLMMQTHIVIIY